MRSLRARVAAAAVLATAAAFVLSGLVVVGTLALEAGGFDGPPPFVDGRAGGPWDGPPGRPPDGPPGSTPGGTPDGPFAGLFEGQGPPPFVRALALRLLLVGVGVLAVVGGAGIAIGGVALRPLARLRSTAERVAGADDLATRLPRGGPEEVDALAGSLNAMLERLQASAARTEATLQASRRFTADAGHELRTPLTSMQANLEVLRRSSNLTVEERRVLDDVLRKQQRLVALLDGLQRLARADAADAVPQERVDLAEVVEGAVAQARVRHPAAAVGFAGPDDVVVDGWADGLRMLVDNLVDNALRHGRADGRVEVKLAVEDGAVVLTVDDDGPGIPPEDRHRVFERFARGATSAPGSGLGLALVAQQAALHGGGGSGGGVAARRGAGGRAPASSRPGGPGAVSERRERGGAAAVVVRARRRPGEAPSADGFGSTVRIQGEGLA